MKSIRSWNCHLLSDSDTSVQKNLSENALLQMTKLRFGSQNKTEQACSVTYSHYGSWSWNQLGVERIGLAKILGFGGILKQKEKNKTASFQRKKWDPISLTSGLHLRVLLQPLLISLDPFPVLGKVPSTPVSCCLVLMPLY